MTSRTREYRQLAMSAERFMAVFAALSDGVLVTDREARVVEANPAAHRLLRRPELVGTRLTELLPPGRADLVDRSDDRVVRRWRMAVDEGETVLEVVTTHTIEEDGMAVGAVHTMRDVTANAQLLRLKEEFIFQVAHELRTPVSSVTASLDLLHQDAAEMSAAERRRMIATLRRSALRLEALVENLLDVGSIQAGTFEVRSAPTNLRVCIKEASFLVEPLTKAKEQDVHVHVARAGERVLVDPRRTTQVIANLLGNASKYAPPSTSIRVSAEPADGYVVVSVSDEGPGIVEAERERVFDRFYRARIGRGDTGGIGLGLAICRAIVEAQGGMIGIATASGGGARVHFTVPRARRDPEEQE